MSWDQAESLLRAAPTTRIASVASRRRQRSLRSRTSRRLSPGRRVVLLVGDVLAPRDGAALVVDLLHREVGHEAVGGGAVPVLLARLEEDPITRPDGLDRA